MSQSPLDRPNEDRLRNVIVHYHLFKNAGTSVDAALKEAFGDKWHAYEGAGPLLTSEELGEYILAHPEFTVFSSHNARFPVPELPDVNIFPIVFLRHPIDRIGSVYRFERQQQADTEGARRAKELSFAEYVRWRLDRKGDYQVRNFQTVRLCAPPGHDATIDEAVDRVESLPFVGLVENYEESIRRLEECLILHFPGVKLNVLRKNFTQASALSLGKRIANARLELGNEYRELLSSNQLDIQLWEKLINNYQYVPSNVDNQ